MEEFSEGDLAEGRQLVAQLDASQWALGDLAIRVAGPSTRMAGAQDGSYGRLAEFANLIGVDGEQLARYRSVATAWPPQQRIDGASWTLHRTLASRPERADELGRFVRHCDAETVTPTRQHMREYLKMAAPSPADERKDPTWRPPWIWEEMEMWRTEQRAFRMPESAAQAVTLADELAAQTAYLVVFVRQYVTAILETHPEWYAELKPHVGWLDTVEGIDVDDDDLPLIFRQQEEAG